MRGIHLRGSKKNLIVLKTYNKPNYIYIKLNSNEEYVLYVKKNDYVYKGTILAKTKGKFTKSLFSSVSGFVEDIDIIDNIKTIKIKNDFKERIESKIESRKEINKISKNEFIDILKNCGIIGMGGAGFPTYVKYDTDNIKTLIINAVECEPYITSDYCLIEERIEEILYGIDAIMEINNIPEAIIGIKKNNKKLKQIIETYIGTYDKIKLVEVPNFYPMGWERNLIKYVKKVDYDRLPSEVGIVVNNISTIYAIYQALKFNKPLIERIIYIGGDMVKNPCNMLVKVGTSCNELLSQISLKRNDNVVLIMSGLMMGIPGDLNSTIMANNNAVMIQSKKELKENPCLRCSKCIQNCPAYIEPVLIKDASHDELIKLHPEKCIECGICSYICPAKINLREKVIKAKKEVKNEKVS